MRIVMTSLAVLALVACNKPAEPVNDMNAADANMQLVPGRWRPEPESLQLQRRTRGASEWIPRSLFESPLLCIESDAGHWFQGLANGTGPPFDGTLLPITAACGNQLPGRYIEFGDFDQELVVLRVD